MTLTSLPQLGPTTAIAPRDPLLASKLCAPEAVPFTVVRARLVERVSTGVRQPILVISGPAGSGKTQLLASWAASGDAPGRVVWVTAEDGDADCGVLWSYVVEGLLQAGVPLSPSVAAPDCAEDVDRHFLARLSADLADQEEPTVLVIDGTETLEDPRLMGALDYVVTHSGRRLHLVLSGRVIPALPLYRFRLAGRLAEIGPADLAFTPDEAAQLMAGHGVGLSGGGLAALVERTLGWAAGLRMFAVALQEQQGGIGEAAVRAVDVEVAGVGEYLRREVLDTQPVDVRDALVRTSILDPVGLDLAEVLTGRHESRELLTSLLHVPWFLLPAGEGEGSVRCHPLLRETLLALLRRGAPDQGSDLHGRAARWLAGRQLTQDAVSHAAAAHDWAYASSLLIADLAVGRVLVGEPEVRRALCELPDDVPSAGAALLSAACALSAGRVDAGETHLSRAEGLARSGIPDESAFRMGCALVAGGLALDRHDAANAEAAAARTEELLSELTPGRRAARPELTALALLTRATVRGWRGELRGATSALHQAAALAESPGLERLRVRCLAQLALVEAHQGGLGRATAAANQAIELAERSSPSAADQYGAQVALAWVAVDHVDVGAAWQHLNASHATTSGPDGHDDQLLTASQVLVRTRLLRARGDLRAALEVAREACAQLDRWAGAPWLQRELVLAQARILVAFGCADEALVLLGRSPGDISGDVSGDGTGGTTPGHEMLVVAAAAVGLGATDRAAQLAAPLMSRKAPVPLRVEACVLRSEIACEHGDVATARTSLRDGLGLAADESYRRPFQEAGPRVRRLLREEEDLAAAHRALVPVRLPGQRRQPGAEPPPGPPVVVEALSAREMEVLGYLAAMLRTEEMAATMYVSVNTVRTHVRSILRKLSASRRNEAVRNARQLNLI